MSASSVQLYPSRTYRPRAMSRMASRFIMFCRETINKSYSFLLFNLFPTQENNLQLPASQPVAVFHSYPHLNELTKLVFGDREKVSSLEKLIDLTLSDTAMNYGNYWHVCTKPLTLIYALFVDKNYSLPENQKQNIWNYFHAGIQKRSGPHKAEQALKILNKRLEHLASLLSSGLPNITEQLDSDLIAFVRFSTNQQRRGLFNSLDFAEQRDLFVRIKQVDNESIFFSLKGPTEQARCLEVNGVLGTIIFRNLKSEARRELIPLLSNDRLAQLLYGSSWEIINEIAVNATESQIKGLAEIFTERDGAKLERIRELLANSPFINSI